LKVIARIAASKKRPAHRLGKQIFDISAEKGKNSRISKTGQPRIIGILSKYGLKFSIMF